MRITSVKPRSFLVLIALLLLMGCQRAEVKRENLARLTAQRAENLKELENQYEQGPEDSEPQSAEELPSLEDHSDAQPYVYDETNEGPDLIDELLEELPSLEDLEREQRSLEAELKEKSRDGGLRVPVYGQGAVTLVDGKLYGKKIVEVIEAKCIRILDGDTIECIGDDKKPFKVRFESIDCPESKQPFGNKAKKLVGDTCFGKKVLICKTGEDRYQRTLAFVFVGDTNLSAQLIENGLAWHYKKYSDDPQLAELEETAKAEKLNIWSDENPVAPWDWRAK